MIASLSVLGVMLLACSSVVAGLPRNITAVLASNPDFDGFNALLSTTGVSEEIDKLHSVTLFLPEQGRLLDSLVSMRTDRAAREWLANICRFHVSKDVVNLSKVKEDTLEVQTLLPGRSFIVEEEEEGEMLIVKSKNTLLSVNPGFTNAILEQDITIFCIDWVMIPYDTISSSNSASVQSTWLSMYFAMVLGVYLIF